MRGLAGHGGAPAEPRQVPEAGPRRAGNHLRRAAVVRREQRQPVLEVST